jgi:hypothetical protein
VIKMSNRTDDQARRDAIWSGPNSKGYLQAARLEEEAWESKGSRNGDGGRAMHK